MRVVKAKDTHVLYSLLTCVNIPKPRETVPVGIGVLVVVVKVAEAVFICHMMSRHKAKVLPEKPKMG